jgi:paraquat-inducible protein B
MSKSKQRATGNKVGGNLTQRSDAETSEQIAESNRIEGDLTQESLSAKKGDINAVLKELLSALDHLDLKDDEKGDLDAHAQTAQAQMKAKKPDAGIVSKSLKSIWETLKGVATTAAVSGAGKLATILADKIQGFFQ